MVFGVRGVLPVEVVHEVGEGGIKLGMIRVDVGEGDFDFSG